VTFKIVEAMSIRLTQGSQAVVPIRLKTNTDLDKSPASWHL